MTEPPRTFGQLLERHEREIFAYALRLTGRRDEADDIFQETFLAAFRAWPPSRMDHVRAWLYRIATRKLIDRRRRAGRLVPLLADLRLASPERDGALAVDLATAIRALPPGQRAAFILHEIQGLPHREVGIALECATEAARARVSDAKRKLREVLR